jgi:hypothetical protein
MKLKSFLTPSSRKGRIISAKRIQERFKIKPEAVKSASTGKPILQTVSE